MPGKNKKPIVHGTPVPVYEDSEMPGKNKKPIVHGTGGTPAPVYEDSEKLKTDGMPGVTLPITLGNASSEMPGNNASIILDAAGDTLPVHDVFNAGVSDRSLEP